jgi:DivIVA domain-containing protein
MTLSLDDVRNKRFRMARKSGYEVLEVDEFVDEVEATFEQLFEENQNLKKQVESLKGTAAGSGSAQAAPAAPAAPEPQPATAAPSTPAAAPAERIVVTTSKDASPAVVRLVQLSTEQSERLVAEAKAEADRIREDASSSAERLQSEARSQAERLQADALGRSQALDRELETRRTDMFGNLEKQREQLTATVNALRAFEATYRSNLTAHLKSQIDVLASGSEEPPNPPAALAEATARANGATSAQSETGQRPTAPDEDAKAADAKVDGDTPAARSGQGEDRPAGSSDTPRLDALLGDQR